VPPLAGHGPAFGLLVSASLRELPTPYLNARNREASPVGKAPSPRTQFRGLIEGKAGGPGNYIRATRSEQLHPGNYISRLLLADYIATTWTDTVWVRPESKVNNNSTR
jgi:hypothetical protein